MRSLVRLMRSDGGGSFEVRRHDGPPPPMPRPAGRNGSPYARCLTLLARLPDGSPYARCLTLLARLPDGSPREEVRAFVRCLERDTRATLSKVQTARLAEIEAESIARESRTGGIGEAEQWAGGGW